MRFLDFIKKYRKPHASAYVDDRRNAKDPDFFRVSGTQVYVGRQGSGKTISAVRHLIEIKNRYPKCIVVTNLKLNIPWEYVTFSSVDELITCLNNVNNDKYGVVYLIDEIHTYFNALESKGIPPNVFTEISQQRKQRKTIIGTSQLFTRIAKPFREQCDTMISCRTYYGIVTFNHAFDGMTLEVDYDGKIIGDLQKKGYFWHSRELRESFDTFQKIESGKSSMMQFDEVRHYEGKKKARKF